MTGRGKTGAGEPCEGRPAGVSLATLAMAALLVGVVLERPAEATGPRTVAGLREALRSLPSPLTLAARDLVGARAPAGLSLASFVGEWSSPSGLTAPPRRVPAVLSGLRPRASLIDLPPPIAGG